MHDYHQLRSLLYSAVVCDALDSLGYHHQSPRPALHLQTRMPTADNSVLIGRCKTTLWADMYHHDSRPYELELRAVDSCQSDDVLIAAAGGSTRSGIWGELLTTAALKHGCVGAIIDGAVRDTAKMTAIGFPVFARGTCVYDSLHRQRVIDMDVAVEIDSVVFRPGELVIADADGIVVIPEDVEQEALSRALAKVTGEDRVRQAIQSGLSAKQAFDKYGIL
ncbi:MAG: hypothetical protein KF752_14645 [Pirellulaceae bacterium]|nr:hypothetical protein [Pirellulaceae bacterium]